MGPPVLLREWEAGGANPPAVRPGVAIGLHFSGSPDRLSEPLLATLTGVAARNALRQLRRIRGSTCGSRRRWSSGTRGPAQIGEVFESREKPVADKH